MSMELDYSVVATTFNDEKSVKRFISELSAQTLQPKEIIIADGGSKDKTVEILYDLSKRSAIPIVVLSGKRLNIAEGYNTAIKNANYNIIGITGLGNRYAIDYFEKLANKMVEGNLDGTYSPIRGLNTTSFSKRYNKDILNGEIGQRMEIASNHGVLLKKKIFDELGYFYERFIYAGEDTEFFLWVKDSGYKMEIVPDAEVRWETPESLFELKKQTKVYSIAGLQINPYDQFVMVAKNLLKIILALVIIASYITILVFPTAFEYKAIATFGALILLIALRKKICLLKIIQKILQIYYTITNRKYAKEEYRVKR